LRGHRDDETGINELAEFLFPLNILTKAQLNKKTGNVTGSIHITRGYL